MEVRYQPNELSWVTPGWSWRQDWDWWKDKKDMPGERRVRVNVKDNIIAGEEIWSFLCILHAIGMWWAESLTPFDVEWKCNVPHQRQVIVVDGIHEWRSHFYRISRLHQASINPLHRIHLKWYISVKT